MIHGWRTEIKKRDKVCRWEGAVRIKRKDEAWAISEPTNDLGT
jgi:hypothetical protein